MKCCGAKFSLKKPAFCQQLFDTSCRSTIQSRVYKGLWLLVCIYAYAYAHVCMCMHVRACICSHVFVCMCVFECKTEYLVQPSTHAMAVACLYKCICTLYNVHVWFCGMLAMDFSTLSAVHYKGTVPTVALDRPVNTRSHDFKSPLRFISLAWELETQG